MNENKYQYLVGFAASVILHAVLIIVIGFKLPANTKQLHMSEPAVVQKVVQARAIDAEKLKLEIQKLKTLENLKKAKKIAEQKQLIQQKKLAQQKRKQEEAKIQKLKAQFKQQQNAIEKAKQKNAQEIAKVAKQKKQEALALQKLQQAKKKEQQKIQALAHKRKKIAAEKQQLAKEKQQTLEQLKLLRKQEQLRLLEKKLQEEEAHEMSSEAIEHHAQLLNEIISENWLQPVGISTKLSCVVEVKLLPDGEVLEAHVVKTSGSVAFDRSSEIAVQKSSPLPMPDDLEARDRFRKFTFTFKPELA